MKLTKVVVGLVVAAVVALVPFTSDSKQEKDKSQVVLSADNVIVLNGEVNGETVAKVISKAKELDAALNSSLSSKVNGNNKPLYLFLNTPGGSIQSGLEMIEALKGIGRPVHTVTLFAASMGFQIAQNLDERYIIKNGVLMSHRARGGFEGEFGGQSPSQIESRYNLWMKRLTEMDEQTVKRSKGKQTLASYQKAYASELWLTGSQSVEGGYADKVVTVKCDASLNGATTHEIVFFGIPIKYDLDNCPLNTTPMNIRVELPTTEGFMDSEQFVKKGGQFGHSCLKENALDPSKLCALDTSMNLQKVKELQAKFVEEYEVSKNKVVYMYW
jgi:ATP-dependent Clp protease, protease subunit